MSVLSNVKVHLNNAVVWLAHKAKSFVQVAKLTRRGTTAQQTRADKDFNFSVAFVSGFEKNVGNPKKSARLANV